MKRPCYLWQGRCPPSCRCRWDLHEYRHSSLTHLGEQGASLLMLMAQSRRKKPENVRRYFKPSPEAPAELTSLLAPDACNPLSRVP